MNDVFSSHFGLSYTQNITFFHHIELCPKYYFYPKLQKKIFKLCNFVAFEANLLITCKCNANLLPDFFSRNVKMDFSSKIIFLNVINFLTKSLLFVNHFSRKLSEQKVLKLFDIKKRIFRKK